MLKIGEDIDCYSSKDMSLENITVECVDLILTVQSDILVMYVSYTTTLSAKSGFSER